MWSKHLPVKIFDSLIFFETVFWRNKNLQCNHFGRERVKSIGQFRRGFNSLDFYPALFKSLGCFYFWCILSSQWKLVTVNLQSLHCQPLKAILKAHG